MKVDVSNQMEIISAKDLRCGDICQVISGLTNTNYILCTYNNVVNLEKPNKTWGLHNALTWNDVSLIRLPKGAKVTLTVE